MPRERTEIFRASNTKPKERIFILAYEGNNTEAIYFEEFRVNPFFNDENIFILSLRRDKGDTRSAPQYVFDKLKKEAKDEFNLNKDDELWMIIDKDQWTQIPLINKLCKKEGNFFLGLSNPCFELWLLLHLKGIDDFDISTQRKIFKNEKIKKGKYGKTYLKHLLNRLMKSSGGYNSSQPRPERFFPTIKKAIERAKAMDDLSHDYPVKLGTNIYKLVEKIIK